MFDERYIELQFAELPPDGPEVWLAASRAEHLLRRSEASLRTGALKRGMIRCLRSAAFTSVLLIGAQAAGGRRRPSTRNLLVAGFGAALMLGATAHAFVGGLDDGAQLQTDAQALRAEWAC